MSLHHTRRERTPSSTGVRRSGRIPRWRRVGRGLALGARRALSAYALRSRTIVCREGLYYLLLTAFVFAGALLGDVNLLMILAGMLIGPLWLSWRLVGRTLRGLEVVRQVPQGVCAGDPLAVKIELRNTRRRLGSWAVLVEEGIRRDGPARGAESKLLRPAVLFSYVPAGESRQRSYRGRLTKRGLYRFEVPAVSTRFPFGLLRRTVRIGAADVLIVHPRLGRLTREWLKRQHEWFEGTHRREVRHGRASGDFYGVRPWRSGDSRRFIHWRSSARHGTLVVRQFEQHRNRDLAVLLDPWQPDNPREEHLETVELAVSFAATVVAEACRRGGGDLWVGTSAAGSEDVHGPASPLVMKDVMDHLAVVEASSAERLEELVERALAAVEPGTEIVLVTTRAVELADAERFPALAVDPVRRSAVQAVRVVNVADPRLSDYFQPED
jgi:uncharacterized protein (DUF58 family)